MVSLSLKNPAAETGLPTEFTLELGPHSSAQLEAMARIFEELGARVERDAKGRLVAVRPS